MSVAEVVPTGYKQTEVGVIPEDWAVQSLQDRCQKIQDGTHFSPRVAGGAYPYVTSKNIGFGTLDISNAPMIDEAQHRAIYRRCDTRFGDILLTKDGASTGNAALNNVRQEISLLSSVAMLRFDNALDTPAYYLQQLLSRPMQARIKDAMSGNAITRLTLTKIKQLTVPICSHDEQHAIANALSDVDALLNALDRLIAKKRALKQATMQQLLTARTRLPGFTGGHAVVGVAELEKRGSVKLGRGMVISKKDIDARPGTFPIYSSSIHNDGMFGRYGDFMFDEELITWSIDGGGDFFYRAKHRFSVTNVCGFMRVDGSVIDARYLAAELQALHASKSFDYQSKAHPSVVRKEYAVQLPPRREQTAIATVLSDMDAEIAALEVRQAKTRDMKQAMMQELLTGKTRLI